MQAQLGEAPPLPLAAFSSQHAPGFLTELSEVGCLGGRFLRSSRSLQAPSILVRSHGARVTARLAVLNAFPSTQPSPCRSV